MLSKYRASRERLQKKHRGFDRRYLSEESSQQKLPANERVINLYKIPLLFISILVAIVLSIIFSPIVGIAPLLFSIPISCGNLVTRKQKTGEDDDTEENNREEEFAEFFQDHKTQNESTETIETKMIWNKIIEYLDAIYGALHRKSTITKSGTIIDKNYLQNNTKKIPETYLKKNSYFYIKHRTGNAGFFKTHFGSGITSNIEATNEWQYIFYELKFFGFNRMSFYVSIFIGIVFTGFHLVWESLKLNMTIDNFYQEYNIPSFIYTSSYLGIFAIIIAFLVGWIIVSTNAEVLRVKKILPYNGNSALIFSKN